MYLSICAECCNINLKGISLVIRGGGEIIIVPSQLPLKLLFFPSGKKARELFRGWGMGRNSPFPGLQIFIQAVATLNAISDSVLFLRKQMKRLGDDCIQINMVQLGSLNAVLQW